MWIWICLPFITGYTISFWIVILNDDLKVKDGILIDNGGYSSHGIAIYWENNKLITKFKKPDGETWMVSDSGRVTSVAAAHCCR